MHHFRDGQNRSKQSQLAYFGLMKFLLKPLSLALGLATCSLLPVTGQVQTEVTEGQETILATLEGPITRETLNATRITLDGKGVKFHYGNFQFHPDTKAIVGFELHMNVEGKEYRDYVDVPTKSCVLVITKETGFRVEGC